MVFIFSFQNSLLKSIKQNFLETQFTFIINVILFFIVTKNFSPIDLLDYTLFILVLGILQLVVDFGISGVLISRKDYSNELGSTVLLVNIIFTFIASALISLYFYYTNINLKLPFLNFLALLISQAVIYNYANYFRVKLQRDLNFKFLLHSSIYSNLFYLLLVGFGLVLYRSVNVLFYSYVLRTIFELVYMHLVIRDRPVFKFSFKETYLVLKSSIYLFQNSLLNSLYEQYMNFYYLGNFSSTSLVLYNRSDYIVQASTRGFAGIVNRVVFAHLSRADKERSQMILFSINLIVSITLILTFLLYFLAGPVISLLLPPSWSDLVYFLKPLLVCSAFYPVQAFYFSEAKSNQKFKQIFKINSLLKLFGVVTFLIFINLMNFEAFKSFVYVQSLLGLALIIMMKKDNYFKSIVWTNLNKILLGGYAVLLTYTLIN